MNAEPFDGWPWPLAPAVIDHIAAARLDLEEVFSHVREGEILACAWPRYTEDGDPEKGEDGPICRWPRQEGIANSLRRAAGMDLTAALAKGKVRAKDSLGVDIEPEFWEYAAIADGGSVINLSSGRKLGWFKVCAAEVLALWSISGEAEGAPVAAANVAADAPPAVAHTAKPRGPRPTTRERVVREMREEIAAGVDLKTWKEEALSAQFKASRDVCRTARKLALASA
jgi:hypothetical protein